MLAANRVVRAVREADLCLTCLSSATGLTEVKLRGILLDLSDGMETILQRTRCNGCNEVKFVVHIR
jgi:hypothetical protein